MNYTSEERMVVRDNLKKIEGWIRENVVSEIEGETGVIIGFGPIVSSVYRPAPHNKYEIYVSSEGDISFRQGASSMYFTDNNDGTDYRSIYDEYPTTVQPIFENWSEIKCKLSEEVEQQLEMKNSMMNFEL